MTLRRLLPCAARATALAAAALLAAGAAQAQQTYKVAYIDMLSGPFANVGEIMLTHIQYAVEDINAKGGVLGGTQLQLLQFDSKLSAQESQSALQAAIDQGVRAVITGGSGSSVVAALMQSVNRWNSRNPGKEIVVLNHSSIDPELTGKSCNFWHFQTEANTAMKMKAIANYIKKTPEVQKVFLLNQDYAHGKQWAAYGRQLGRVKDFAPDVANIRQSGADSVISGNWGQDMTLLLKSAGDAGYDLRYFNHSAGAAPGTVTAVSQARMGRVTWVAEWHPGQAGVPKAEALAKAYKARTGKDFLAPRIDMTPRILAAAINKAGSTESLKVARAMEGLEFDSVVGKVRMRAEDHQLLIPQVVNTIAKVDGKAVTVGWEGTDYGFRTDAVYSGNEVAQGTECRMQRP